MYCNSAARNWSFTHSSMDDQINEKSSASAFLWKAAISTIDVHPTIAANLLLRCRKALNCTKIGVKFRKISKSNICQSCGNPWSMGKYKLKLKKTFKTTKIQKVFRQTKNSKKISLFNKHILDRYSERKSNILIKCGSCFKDTAFPTPLPPKEVKSVKHNSLSSEKQKNKKSKIEDLVGIKNKSGKQRENLQRKSNSTKPTKVIKPAKKQQFSRSQLKNISKSISKNSTVKSSLQSFLSSVK